MLARAEGEAEAYPALLAAIGGELGCAGALWLPGDDGKPHCAHAWPADAAAAAALAVDVWETGRPAAQKGAFAFPLPGVGVMGFSTSAPLEPDAYLLATMDSLGLQISQFVERCRAVHAVRESDARKSAILNAAFDCIITMDHNGDVVEVNRAAELTFGYRAEEMIGRELAALIVPPSWRDGHRAGLERYLRTGRAAIGGHPIEAEGMRKDGSVFPVELVVTEPEMPGPKLFCGYLRDVTEAREREAALRRLAEEQAALRRVATAVASETDPRHAFEVVTEELARLMSAQTASLVRFGEDGTATAVGAWNSPGARGVPIGTALPMDGDTATSRVYRTRAPARVDSYEGLEGEMARELRRVGFHAAVAAPCSSTASCGER